MAISSSGVISRQFRLVKGEVRAISSAVSRRASCGGVPSAMRVRRARK
jgi:hypothetical protein